MIQWDRRVTSGLRLLLNLGCGQGGQNFKNWYKFILFFISVFAGFSIRENLIFIVVEKKCYCHDVFYNIRENNCINTYLWETKIVVRYTFPGDSNFMCGFNWNSKPVKKINYHFSNRQNRIRRQSTPHTMRCSSSGKCSFTTNWKAVVSWEIFNVINTKYGISNL